MRTSFWDSSENFAVSRPNGWLEGRFHFSFADYFNANNIGFGTLRVLNEDIVRSPGSFGCAFCSEARCPVAVCARGVLRLTA